MYSIVRPAGLWASVQWNLLSHQSAAGMAAGISFGHNQLQSWAPRILILYPVTFCTFLADHGIFHTYIYMYICTLGCSVLPQSWNFASKLWSQNDHFQACRRWSSMVAKVQGGPHGWLRWVRTKLIIFKSFFNMIFKIGPFPLWNFHQKWKWLVSFRLWV